MVRGEPQEMFVVVGSAAEAGRVHERNDDDGRRVIGERARAIREAGVLHHGELPDQRRLVELELVRAEAERRIRTTMVGAWNAVEDLLGWLWGEGKDPADRTPQEEELHRRFRGPLRERVMDLGNDQIRGLQGRPRRAR